MKIKNCRRAKDEKEERRGILKTDLIKNRDFF
jgi:hypothetical protein